MSGKVCPSCGYVGGSRITCPRCRTTLVKASTIPVPLNADGTKKCPYCAEDIQAAAIVCKHCGRDLGDQGAGRDKTKKRSLAPWVLGLGIGAVALFGFYVWGTSGASFDLADSNRLVDLLIEDKVLTALECGPPASARLQRASWNILNDRRRRNLMGAISRVCYEKTRDMKVDLSDEKGQPLAEFDGRNVVR